MNKIFSYNTMYLLCVYSHTTLNTAQCGARSRHKYRISLALIYVYFATGWVKESLFVYIGCYICDCEVLLFVHICVLNFELCICCRSVLILLYRINTNSSGKKIEIVHIGCIISTSLQLINTAYVLSFLQIYLI